MPTAATMWRVVGVHDGDTLTALDPANVQHKVRLAGVDAPEIGQPFGAKAREGLAGMAMGKAVAVLGDERDRYGRIVARIEADGQDVNRAMVTAGLAWHFTRYSDDATLAAAEAEARAERRGLWADGEAMPPWEWRAAEKGRKRAGGVLATTIGHRDAHDPRRIAGQVLASLKSWLLGKSR